MANKNVSLKDREVSSNRGTTVEHMKVHHDYVNQQEGTDDPALYGYIMIMSTSKRVQMILLYTGTLW